MPWIWLPALPGEQLPAAAPDRRGSGPWKLFKSGWGRVARAEGSLHGRAPPVSRPVSQPGSISASHAPFGGVFSYSVKWPHLGTNIAELLFSSAFGQLLTLEAISLSLLGFASDLALLLLTFCPLPHCAPCRHPH